MSEVMNVSGSTPPPVSADEPSRDVWALTFQRSPVGMALVGLDGQWIEVNESLCRMLGYSSPQLAAMTFQDITHPEDLDRDLSLLQECLDGTRSDYRLVKRYLHARGSIVWGDLSVALVSAADGTPSHFISQILDISAHRADQDRLEEALNQLEEANTDLARFAAVVSHDLKTPLTATRASLELLGDHLATMSQDDLTELGQARQLAARAESSTERMAAMIDALLAYTTTDPRLSGAEGGKRTSRMSVAEVVRAAVNDVRVLLESSGSVLTLAPNMSSQPPCSVSAPLIRTVVVNLLTNAVKYRDRSRVLSIRVDATPHHEDPSMLLVRVGNDGPVIAPEHRERVFDYLRRGDRRDEVDGLGIGLAACRRVVEWHGGQMWIEEPSREGVDFCLTLPLAAPRHPVVGPVL